MQDSHYVQLTNRGIISLTGSDTLAFLQGIVTNDVNFLSEKKAMFSTLLTPQGKYLVDFFIFKLGSAYYIDCKSNRIQDLIRRLKLYKLRANVKIKDISENYRVYALSKKSIKKIPNLILQPGNMVRKDGGVVFVDPRLLEMGARGVIPTRKGTKFFENLGFTKGKISSYNLLRISLGVCEFNKNSPLDQSFPLELGFEELNGISFDKGCYVGQEVIIRIKNRSLLKKHLVSVTFCEGTPKPGIEITQEGTQVGVLYEVEANHGIAMVRLDALDLAFNKDKELKAGFHKILPKKLKWMRL
ncbi:MAG: hypothetical protein VX780_13975 [Pseudomonadota bacterium]|nr:hypothetical protein [Pseudomonadota bacterium]